MEIVKILLVLILIVVISLIANYVLGSSFLGKYGKGSVNNNILIVGAGPVGLVMAYMLSVFPKNTVVLVEKYPCRIREQILLLDPHSLDVLNFIAGQDISNKLCKSDLPPFDLHANCYIGPEDPNGLDLRLIRIKDLEEVMYNELSMANRSNITIIEPNRRDCNGRELGRVSVTYMKQDKSFRMIAYKTDIQKSEAMELQRKQARDTFDEKQVALNVQNIFASSWNLHADGVINLGSGGQLTYSGRATPHSGRATPHSGRATPHSGRATPHSGKYPYIQWDAGYITPERVSDEIDNDIQTRIVSTPGVVFETNDTFHNRNDGVWDFTPSIVVAADGANSTIGRLFNNPVGDPIGASKGYVYLIPEKWNTILTDKLKSQNYKTEDWACPQHRHRLLFGRHPDGHLVQTYLGTQLYISETDDPSNPLSPNQLQRIIQDGLRYYDMDPRIVNDVKITPQDMRNIFPIEPSERKYKTQKVDDMHIFYVGDSYIRVNFFSGTGVNYGITMAVQLADLLNTYDDISRVTREYEEFVNNLISVQSSGAVQLDFEHDPTISRREISTFIKKLPQLQQDRLNSMQDLSNRRRLINTFPMLKNPNVNPEFCKNAKQRVIKNLGSRISGTVAATLGVMDKYRNSSMIQLLSWSNLTGDRIPKLNVYDERLGRLQDWSDAKALLSNYAIPFIDQWYEDEQKTILSNLIKK